MSELEKLYNELESKKDFSPIIIICTDYSDKEQQFAEKESYALRNDCNDKFLLLNDINKEEWVEYYQRRYSATKNKCLKAKYSDALYCLTHSKEWYKITINWHKSIIEENITNENGIYGIHIVVDCLIKLSYDQKKIVLPETKDFLMNIMKNSSCEIQLFLIQVGHKNDLFKKSESKDIVDLCVKSARQITDYGFKRSFLNEGIYYAQKDTSLNTQKKQMFEMLGDNEATQLRDISTDEKNIAIAHLNQNYLSNMINFYHKASCLKKEQEAYKRLNSNKSNLRFITIKESQPIQPEFQKMMEDRYKTILGLDHQCLFLYLTMGDCFVFPPEKMLPKIQIKESEISQMFAHSKIDLNGNSSPIKDINEYNKYFAFDIFTRNNLWMMKGAFLEGIKNKKITYPHLIKYFNRTCFSEPISFNRSGSVIEYTWLSCVDYALRDFINQSKRYIVLKKTDWRFATDSLSLKFEGILRDMLAIYCGSTTKRQKNEEKGYSEMLLDDILRDPRLKDVFSQDDINLFFYVFTNKWFYNIRNYVAHGFFKPQDYDFKKAFLVFLCIIRLTKYSIKSNQPCHD